MSSTEWTVGWDVGGAHLKACLVQAVAHEAGTRLQVRDAAEWACPLWQGLHHLREAIAAAQRRWPQCAGAAHAATMTGEMVDLFAHREVGTLALGDALAATLQGPIHFYAAAAGWCGHAELAARWREVASANWHAGAALAARRVEHGVWVDIGSTTTDLIALAGGRVHAQGPSDAERLASGELVYHGVVRTPLCALAPRVVHRGREFNVMNEFFATSADVYRLTGELDPGHDLQPAADGAGKDPHATRQRLARMIGLDARDASEAQWLATAEAWRALQLTEIAGQLRRVLNAAGLPAEAPLVAAGCGDFLVARLAAESGRPCLVFADLVGAAADTGAAPARGATAAVPGMCAALARRIQVAAPSVAVALLLGERALPAMAPPSRASHAQRRVREHGEPPPGASR